MHMHASIRPFTQTLLAGFCLPTCLDEAAPAGFVSAAAPPPGFVKPTSEPADGDLRGLFDTGKPLTPKHQRSRALRLSH